MQRRLALWILGALFLGFIAGIALGISGLHEFVKNWISPFGEIFIRLLQMVAIPLIITSLISGVAHLSDMARLSRLGLLTIAYYLFTTTVAIIIGLLLVNITQPGKLFPPEQQEIFSRQFKHQVEEKASVAQEVSMDTPLRFLVDMVPKNVFRSVEDNKKMLQVIFFAIFLGLALAMSPRNKVQTAIKFFEGLNEAILKMVELIMLFAPIGVFALMTSIIVDFAKDGEITSMLEALGTYMLTVIIGLFILILFLYPAILKFVARFSPIRFFREIYPVQMVAFSTSSSAATLPVTMKVVTEKLRVPDDTASFVLPLGATINMDGTALYQAVAAVFIAQAMGWDLTFSQQATIVLTATLASIGAAAVPGAGIVMLVIILQALGIGPAGVALILAVDRPLDMLRTVVNVTSDATCAVTVSKLLNEKS